MKSRGFISLVLFISLISCNKDTAPDLVKSAGKTVSQERQIEDFSRLFIQDKMDVELIQDSQLFVEIEYGENLIKKINTEVIEGELVLSNANTFNWVRKLDQRVKIKLHCKRIDNIEIVGDASLFNTDTFYGDRVNFDHEGTNMINLIMNSDWATFRCSNIGGIVLKGSCGILSGTVEQTAVFDGRDFLAIDAYFYHYSLSNSFVNAKMVYGLNIYGEGNLFYLQEPLRKFEVQEKGNGKVIKL